jgi:hypothetical protein
MIPMLKVEEDAGAGGYGGTTSRDVQLKQANDVTEEEVEAKHQC